MPDSGKSTSASPDTVGNTTFVREPSVSHAPRGGRTKPAPRSHAGTVYAVPVIDIVGSSGWLLESLYRALEIVIAVTGLIFGLPIMLIMALVIRWDSPGPALFFHTRPRRSKMVRGRELKGRSDLRPPPAVTSRINCITCRATSGW